MSQDNRPIVHHIAIAPSGEHALSYVFLRDDGSTEIGGVLLKGDDYESYWAYLSENVWPVGVFDNLIDAYDAVVAADELVRDAPVEVDYSK